MVLCQVKPEGAPLVEFDVSAFANRQPGPFDGSQPSPGFDRVFAEHGVELIQGKASVVQSRAEPHYTPVRTGRGSPGGLGALTNQHVNLYARSS